LLPPLTREPFDDERPEIEAGRGLLARDRSVDHSHIDVCDFYGVGVLTPHPTVRGCRSPVLLDTNYYKCI